MAECFDEMRERAKRDWIQLLLPDRGSYAGLTHLDNVVRNVEKILPNNMKNPLSPGELFLLLSAVLFHDIGRIYPAPEKSPTLPCKNDSIPKRCKKTHPPCMDWHWNHHVRSRFLIEKYGLAFGLPDDKIKKYCALLAYCHGLATPPYERQLAFQVDNCKHNPKVPSTEVYGVTSVEPYGPLRIPLLAALLRIADEAENHWNRAYGERWFEEFRTQLREQEKDKKDPEKAANQAFDRTFFKAFRRNIEDVEFCHDGECITIHLETGANTGKGSSGNGAQSDEELSPKELKRFGDNAKKLQVTLDNWNKELKPLGHGFSRVYFKIGGKLQKIDGNGKKMDKPLEVLREDTGLSGPLSDSEARISRMGELAEALATLSETTMGYPEFHWTALESKVGRKLTDHDSWLIERMAEWAPDTIKFDSDSKVVSVKERNLQNLREKFIEQKINVGVA
ncbi:MAG: hypothetical protein ABSE82_11875 [Nitrososphaerales archaeon]